VTNEPSPSHDSLVERTKEIDSPSTIESPKLHTAVHSLGSNTG